MAISKRQDFAKLTGRKLQPAALPDAPRSIARADAR